MTKPATHMRVAWFLLALGVAAASLAHVEQQALDARGETAERINAGFVACVSDYHLEQYEIATHRQQVEIMMQDSCLPTERLTEHPFVVLNQGGGTKGIERIRVFLPDDQFAELYVPVAAVTKGRM